MAADIPNEDALNILLMQQKIVEGHIPEDFVRLEPKKHLGGRVRGGAVSFEEALQVTVPYNAETE